MKKHLRLKMMAVFTAVLCLSISNAWGANKGAILHVDGLAAENGDGLSWATAYTDLQDALAAAVSGDEIWVAVGTYKPNNSGDRSVSFVLKSGVALYGGFVGGEKALRERSLDPSLTILSGDIGTDGDDTDNSFHVVYADGVTGAVLDGFTVTRGHGDGGDNPADYLGGGIHTRNSAFTVSNCIFSKNKVAIATPSVNGAGGGMYNMNSALTVTNCIFSENQAGNTEILSNGSGGGMYNDGNFNNGGEDLFSVITGCIFRDNLAPSVSPTTAYGGGGIYNGKYCSPIIDRCTFERNLAGFGGGMLNVQSGPIITNCIFNTNSNTYVDGRGGAIYNNSAGAHILNCTFYQNGWRLMPQDYPFHPRFRPYTYYGSAIYDFYVGTTITNCIFIKNAAKGLGGVYSYVRIELLETTLTNCLFYENICWNGFPDSREEALSHTDGEFHPDSANNLYDIDPLLVNPEAGDFHLDFDSPCIDAGYGGERANYVWPFGLPATDFEGDRRIADSDGDGVPAIDIGADEFIPNIPDLGWFIQSLADTGEIEQAMADSLLVYVDDAQAALDWEDEQTAINLLNNLIAEAWDLLEDTETAQVIEMKTRAVIEEI